MSFAIALFGLFGLLGLLGPSACSFDGSGVGVSSGRDLHLIEGPSDARAPDKAKHDAPVPDLARIEDGHADRVTKHDLGTTKDLPSAKDQPGSKPDLKPSQGQSCTSGPNTITADKVPLAKASLTMTVHSQEASWVMAGVSADQPPAKQSFTWAGHAKTNGCKDHWCSWTFPTVLVPNKPGPYTFGFMVDAAGDKPNNGHIVFTCVP